jgi:hypothetical protein
MSTHEYRNEWYENSIWKIIIHIDNNKPYSFECRRKKDNSLGVSDIISNIGLIFLLEKGYGLACKVEKELKRKYGIVM